MRQCCKWMWKMKQETAFTELKSQLASSHVMADFSQETAARDVRGYSSGISNKHVEHTNLCVSLMYT